MVLVSGSGPQDRNEQVAGHKPFLILADHLTRQGIAVLRYDDRGVGESTGDFGSATIQDFVTDAESAVRFLQSRKEVDGERIGLIGHSEGGLVIPLVASRIPEHVSFLVLMAAPGIPGEQIFYLQDAAEARARGVDEGTIERSRSRKQQIFSILKNEPSIELARKELQRTMRAMELTAEEEAQMQASGVDLEMAINQQIQLLNNAATRFFLVHDPIPILSKTTVPVLAITGALDLQVPPAENLIPIKTALSEGPCPHFLVKELPSLNHLFQTSTTGLPSNYAQISETMAPAALKTISDWILETIEVPQSRDGQTSAP